jgi:hypothetical protein
MPLLCTHQLLGESEEYLCYWNETWLVSQVMSRIWSLAYFLQAIRLVLTQHYVLSLSFIAMGLVGCVFYQQVV